MAKFTLTGTRYHPEDKAVFIYDNIESTLTMEDGVTSVIPVTFKNRHKANVVSIDTPGIKGNIKLLKVSLGLSCNYECSYCSQRFVPNSEQTNPDDIESFLESLINAKIDSPQRIEFWGGEPFVYWKTLKPLAERLKEMFPLASLHVITNGSLLDTEKNEWLDTLSFYVGISHDGPGYHVRGADPMDDPEKRVAILDLYNRLKPKGRISINAMMHSGNQSRSAVQQWMVENFGEDVVIGEGAFIDPYDDGGLGSVLKSDTDHFNYRMNAFQDIRTGNAQKFSIATTKIVDFVESISGSRHASTIGQKCGMDKKENIAVDLRGNVLTCQNVSAASTAPNGQSNKLGNINDMVNVKLNTSTHWSKREECSSCPVLQLCQGSCMFLEGPLWDAGCDASFTDNIPFFVAAIEYLTGYSISRIDGDFRETRKDIFGLTTKVVENNRVIPIQAI